MNIARCFGHKGYATVANAQRKLAKVDRVSNAFYIVVENDKGRFLPVVILPSDAYGWVVHLATNGYCVIDWCSMRRCKEWQ